MRKELQQELDATLEQLKHNPLGTYNMIGTEYSPRTLRELIARIEAEAEARGRNRE